MSKIKVNRIENTSTTSGGIDINSSGHVKVDGLQLPTAGSFSNRNLIVNGSMRINTRDSAAYTNNGYTLDRYEKDMDHASDITVSQDSIDYPPGFTHSIKLECTNVATLNPSDSEFLQTSLEGTATSSMGYTDASPNPVTLSFYAKASIAGVYCVTLSNKPNDYIFVSTYTINTANTWEYKTITITPPASPTSFSNDIDVNVRIKFDVGSGSNYETTTINAWQSGNKGSISSAVKLNQNVGATLRLSGLQLEVGSTSTPFEHLSYDIEEYKCKRYCQSFKNLNNSPGTYGLIAGGWWADTTKAIVMIDFHPTMRATPTLVSYQKGYALAPGINWFMFNSVSIGGQSTNQKGWFNLNGVQHSGSVPVLSSAYWGNMASVVVAAEL